MKSSASLTSHRLQFARGGRSLLVLDEAQVVDVATGARRRLPVMGAVAITGFADQVWVVAGGTLHRFGIDGARIGAPSSVPDAPGAQLVGAPLGGAAAIWTAEPARALIEDGAELRVLPISDPGLVMPMTGRRWVTAHQAQVRAPSGIRCELPPPSRVTAGAVVLDGTAAALVVERPAMHELVVIGLAHGRVLLRRPLPTNAAVRIAARRGLALIATDADRCMVLDLRSGRALGELRAPHALVDVAVDADGDAVAVETAHGLEVWGLREHLAQQAAIPASDAVVAATPEPAAVATVPRQIPIQSAPPSPAAAETRPLDLRALVPVPRTTGVARSIALAMLDHDVRAVALWTLQAIAHAWDTRSLGYGNEGKHPYELEVAALLGMNSGFANDYVGAARDHLATFEAALPPHPRTIDTPIGLLAAELGLSDLAIDVLLVVAAPAVWGEAARLYGILANDPARPLVDEQLVLQILAHRASRHDLAAVLDPRGALVRLGLVHMDLSRPRPFAALSIDPVVLSRLRCEQPDLGAALSVRTSDRALEELSLAVGVVAAITAGLATWHGPLRLALSGRPGSGRRALLAALAAEAGRPLGVLDVTQLPRTEREFQLGFARGLRTAHLAGLLPCVTGIEEVSLGERAARDVVADILRAHPGPLAILQSAGAPAVLQAGHIGVELPVLDEGERLGLWQQTLADARLPVADVADLAAKYRIGPGTIHRAVSAAIERRGGHGPADATDELRTFIRQTRDARLGAYARRVERLVGWDALVLPSDIIDSLRELISRVRHRRTVFETWGMDRAMSTSRGLTALFQGQPGTGKTMVASVIAKELGLDLYQVDLSKVMSKWLGETERNLAAIFDAAEDGQVILLFDEADSLFAKRTEVRSSNDRYANLEVNYLLQRLDAFEGMAILTTNNGGSIDPAFKRRLSFRLSFPFPDEDTRTQLWRAHLPPRLPIAGELALERLAHKYQLAGGYIRNACLRAAFLAAQDETSLTQQHLERAVALEFAELGKLSTGGSLD